MLADARENLAQVGLGLKAIETCRADQRVEDRGPPAAGVGAQEQPILGPELQRPNGIFRGVVRDFQSTIIDIARQRVPSPAGVANGTGELALAGNELQLLVEPEFQCIEPGFGGVPANASASLGNLACDGPLDVEQRTDLVEGLLGDR